jgi:hypothetical protein
VYKQAIDLVGVPHTTGAFRMCILLTLYNGAWVRRKNESEPKKTGEEDKAPAGS